MIFTIAHEREEDGRRPAEVPEIPGVLAYGDNCDEAIARTRALALRVLADQLVQGEATADLVSISFAAA